MTTKGKVIVTISALVILSGAGFLLYKFVIKPSQDKKKKEPVTPEVTPTTVTNNNSNTVTNPPPVPYSKFGFKKGDKLFAKSNYMPVYSYPDLMDDTKHIGYINKSSIPKMTFISDANSPGWVKVIAQYTLKTSASQDKVGEVYVLASGVTNLAP